MANVLHAMVVITTIVDWIHHVIYTHQLKHREYFRIKDDRPCKDRCRQGVDNGLGKNPLRRVFFRPKKSTYPVGAAELTAVPTGGTRL